MLSPSPIDPIFFGLEPLPFYSEKKLSIPFPDLPIPSWTTIENLPENMSEWPINKQKHFIRLVVEYQANWPHIACAFQSNWNSEKCKEIWELFKTHSFKGHSQATSLNRSKWVLLEIEILRNVMRYLKTQNLITKRYKWHTIALYVSQFTGKMRTQAACRKKWYSLNEAIYKYSSKSLD